MRCWLKWWIGWGTALLSMVGCSGASTGESAWLSPGRWVWEGEPASWNRPLDQLQFQKAELDLFALDSFSLYWEYSSKTPGRECSGEEQRGRWIDEGTTPQLLLVTLEQRERCTPPLKWEKIYLRENIQLRAVTERAVQICFVDCDSGTNWLSFQKEVGR